MKKKILSIFLAVVMIVGMIPFGTISVSSADISNAWFGSDANTAAGAFELDVYNGSIRVSGWVVDPKNAQNSYDAEVHIYIKRGDTKYLFYAITETPVLRDDVNRNEGVQRYCPGITGNHGFDVYIPTVCGYDGESKGQPLSGNYSIDIYAVSKAGGNNHLFGTYSCTLKAPTVFDANGGELGDVPATQCKTGNATSTLPTAVPTKAGYVFKEWNTDINGNGTAYQSGAECEYSGTLYAQWTKDHNNLTFKSWNSSNSLPTTAGNWELTKDITLTGTWTVPAGTTNLCLNGHIINLNGGNRIRLENSNAKLYLYDCGTATEHYFTYRQNDYWSLIASPTNEQKSGAVSLDDITGTTTTNTVIKVSGGAITGGTDGYGNVEIADGTFTMNGGNIIGHTHPDAGVQGGGVRVTGTFNMNGGLIAGCKVRAEGGGVYVRSNGTFNMNGGTIAFNTSADKEGGGIYNIGTFNMSGGTIAYNTAGGNGGGVMITAGEMRMTGGTIHDNSTGMTGGAIGNSGGKLYISGGEIYNNNATKQYGGGGIGVWGLGYGEISDTAFIHDNTGINGGGVLVGDSGVKVVISGGTIENCTATTGNGGGVYIKNNGAVEMSGGTIENNIAKGKFGGGVSVHGGAEFIMSDGTISGCTVANQGGGVFVEGTFNMSGGTIENNEATLFGGGVQVYDNGTFNMTGGSIINNIAGNAGGGVNSNSTTTIENAVITGNTCTNNGQQLRAYDCTFTIKEYCTIDNGTNDLYQVTNNITKSAVTFDKQGGNGGSDSVDPATYNSAMPTVTVPTLSGHTFLGYFDALSGGTKYYNADGTSAKNWDKIVAGATLYAQWAVNHSHDEIIFEPWDGTPTLMPTKAGNYYLTKDITFPSPWIWTVPEGETNLCLNGHIINLNGGNRIKLENSKAILNLYDCGTATEHYFTYRQNDYWSLISAPTDEQKAAAISLDAITNSTATGTVIKIPGGAITDGTGGYGHVEIVGGTFTMNGGNIIGHNNPAENVQGGGVRVSGNGTFDMNGGLIAGCKVGAEGGGVIVYSGSTFNMNGGTIAFNTSSGKTGGGVHNIGTFNMSGGTIEYCFAGGNSESGGGVYNSGTFNMSDGIIQYNQAKASDTNGKGGGVYNSGTFTMSDGIIQNNTANRWGGGVLNGNGTFTMTGGSVINNCVLNTKTYDGGGAGIFGSNVTISNATITGNKCDENGKGKGNQIRGNSNTVIKDYCTIENDDNNDLYSVTNNITKTAITFDKLGGNGGSDSVDPAYNSAMPKITVPTLSGCTFLGYFDAPVGGTKYYNADGTSAKNWDKIVADTTLYAQWKYWTILTGETDEDGKTIESGYYYVNADTLCQATEAGKSGLNIAENSTVYLYIPAGVTLTCTGANASGKTGGGAGIYLPESATLHIYGEGTLKATGGNAAAGENGTNGGNGWFTGSYNNGSYGSGEVGNGGNGGGGAGAGIGTPGGDGGAGGVGTPTAQYQTAALVKDRWWTHSVAGMNGGDGNTADQMGTLYVQSSVNLNAVGGEASTTAGAAGAAGKSIYDQIPVDNCYWTAGGSAGGGGGGSGYGAEDIGTGGAGGAGGGSGSKAASACASSGFYYTVANGGIGGTGYVNGENGTDAKSTTLYKNGNQSQTVTATKLVDKENTNAKAGGASGAAGGESVAYSDDTSFDGVTFNITYLDENDAVYGTDTYTVGSTSTVTLPDYAGYAWQIVGLGKPCGPDSDFTSYSDKLLRGTVGVCNVYGDLVFKAVLAPYTVTLNLNGGTGGTAFVTATFDSAMPNITVPTKENSIFLGYFDAATGGTKYYNADGTSAKTWDKASDTTLYAQWQKLTYEYYLVEAPTIVNGNGYVKNGLCNQRSYYINSSNEKIIVEEKLLGNGYQIDFAGWYLRTFAQCKTVDGTKDVRLISMLNGDCFDSDSDKLLDYDYAGFEIQIDGKEVSPAKTNIANTSFLANGKEIFIADYSRETDFFFLANTLFAKELVDANVQITVTPFVTLDDGTTIKGKTVSFKLGDLK